MNEFDLLTAQLWPSAKKHAKLVLPVNIACGVFYELQYSVHCHPYIWVYISFCCPHFTLFIHPCLISFHKHLVFLPLVHLGISKVHHSCLDLNWRGFLIFKYFMYHMTKHTQDVLPDCMLVFIKPLIYFGRPSSGHVTKWVS